MPCRDHLAQLRERRSELEDFEARLVAVAFESPSAIRQYQDEERLQVPLFRDPGRKAYRRFGLGRGEPSTIWGPQTLAYYGRELLRGRLPAKHGADAYQLGGDVILRPDLSGGWVYRSQHPADRPSVDSVICRLRSTRAVS
ncbi:MAG: AhpC/TSA family protein [Chloroflexota bacterium]